MIVLPQDLGRDDRRQCIVDDETCTTPTAAIRARELPRLRTATPLQMSSRHKIGAEDAKIRVGTFDLLKSCQRWSQSGWAQKPRMQRNATDFDDDLWNRAKTNMELSGPKLGALNRPSTASPKSTIHMPANSPSREANSDTSTLGALYVLTRIALANNTLTIRYYRTKAHPYCDMGHRLRGARPRRRAGAADARRPYDTAAMTRWRRASPPPLPGHRAVSARLRTDALPSAATPRSGQQAALGNDLQGIHGGARP